MSKEVYTYYALIGGACGSLGSTLGKFAGKTDYWIITIGLLVAMVLVNTFGVMLFTKSLNFAPSSLQPVLFSTASSYISSAILGIVFFDEALSYLWCLGTLLVILGMLFLHLNKEKVD
ncbi:uncharacterized protein LOC106662981 [Cimex lectularius]|uniref:Uncharacterized protein n=1 Tax=Cimex lectularius TaxID=79782 RepID=A0A8I6RBK6_CIMLE|nr:uncharacterized protein LOC106662981 [Cimex lectularius]